MTARISFGFLVLSLASSVACTSTDEHPTVVIGALIDQTGNNSELSWLQAVQLAVRQMNEALGAEGNPFDFRFELNAQNSENDVVGGPDSRAIQRLGDIVDAGGKASIVDTTQVAEETNKPMNNMGITLQCSSCTGGSFLNASSTVTDDPELQASRRNADHWMQRTIMSTGSLSVVIAQMIYGMPRHGDLNNDGIIKVGTYGSDESFGQSTTLAGITELKKKFASLPELPNLRFERLLHINDNDVRNIPFADDMARLSNNFNEDLPPKNGTTDINSHLFALPPVSTTDGVPDIILVATFARNGVAFVAEYKAEGLDQEPNRIQIMHFHTFRFSSNLLALGELAEGQIGASHVIIDGPNGDQFAADFKGAYGLKPVYRDSIYYDNAATMVLASLMAIANSGAPATDVTGAQIRDVFPCTSTNAARLIPPTSRPDLVCPAGESVDVGPGVEGFRAAIRAILAGEPIEYTGASGPIDYDALGNVKGRVASYEVIAGQYEDTAQFDCITSAACLCGSGDCPSQVP